MDDWGAFLYRSGGFHRSVAAGRFQIKRNQPKIGCKTESNHLDFHRLLGKQTGTVEEGSKPER